MKRKKIIYLEIMRIISIIFVIFNHTNGNGFFLFSKYSQNSLLFWINLFISIFCKFSVPLFFMISGAIYLKKENEQTKDILKKICKFFLILIIFSIIYYLKDVYDGKKELDFVYFFETIYSKKIIAHLNFLYYYIAYLISLPFLRSLVRNLEDKYFYFLIIISVVFGILPIIEYIFLGGLAINNNIKVSWLLSKIVIYPVIGYFLENRINVQHLNKKIIFIWILNIVLIIIECFATYYQGNKIGYYSESISQTFFNNFTLINCISIFLTIKYLYLKYSQKISKKLEKIILILSECTFGIYLIHLLFKKTILFNKILYLTKNIWISPMITIWIYVLMLYIFCFIITFMLRKIPFIKKYI